MGIKIMSCQEVEEVANQLKKLLLPTDVGIIPNPLPGFGYKKKYDNGRFRLYTNGSKTKIFLEENFREEIKRNCKL